MKYYDDDTVYFISYAKLPTEISAAALHKVVGIGLIINIKTGRIVDVSCTLLTQEAKDFMKSILVGRNVHEEDVDEIIQTIKQRYHGYAQKAVGVATRGTIERYNTWKIEQEKK
ncbi:DUF3870 domain-containing protein [Natronincola ferrireducens]|uniref:DUF3870 domain-containing protein n=1 Tax=Natronincola ferrireducens TaxID=393762 RepID=A0A1G8XEE4_9FIRM|nr:DUF3870 domain-containing protein [Natronincola ferrireducens]SDJ88786.1 protein of unknown function [Natronincola ferrireducens]